MKLNALINATQGELIGESVDFSAISIDTRTLEKGQAYLAIIGERYDGHAFFEQAVQAGASALIVSSPQSVNIPQLVVKDTTEALAQISAWHRAQFDIPMFAVTGSCGKTTVKQMLWSIMSQVGSVLATKGNLNNHIGLPLSLLRLSEQYQFGIFELGANHVGEIIRNGQLVRPNISAITTIAPAHVEGFGSIDNIARAKSEIFESLIQEGVAIAEVDSPYLAGWKSMRSDLTWLTFGLTADADISAQRIQSTSNTHTQFELVYQGESIDIRLPLLGQHNVKNATAAAAMAIAAGVSLSVIQKGLADMTNVGGRLAMQTLKNGAVLIDDSYNANPSSIKAAIDTMLPVAQKRVLVLGDMGELGPDAEQYHTEVGAYAKRAGIERLYVIGAYSAATAEGYNGGNAIIASTKQELIEKLQHELSDNVVCLVKGSRSAKMEDIVLGLTQSN